MSLWFLLTLVNSSMLLLTTKGTKKRNKNAPNLYYFFFSQESILHLPLPSPFAMPGLSYEIPQFWPVDSSAPLIHSCNCKYSGVPLKGWLDAASGLIVSYDLQNYASTAKRTQLQGELLWHTLCNVIQSNAMFSKHEPLCHFVFIYTGLKN